MKCRPPIARREWNNMVISGDALKAIHTRDGAILFSLSEPIKWSRTRALEKKYCTRRIHKRECDQQWCLSNVSRASLSFKRGFFKNWILSSKKILYSLTFFTMCTHCALIYGYQLASKQSYPVWLRSIMSTHFWLAVTLLLLTWIWNKCTLVVSCWKYKVGTREGFHCAFSSR